MAYNWIESFGPSVRPAQEDNPVLNNFDKVCATLAFGLGLVLLSLGVAVHFDVILIDFPLTPIYSIPDYGLLSIVDGQLR